MTKPQTENVIIRMAIAASRKSRSSISLDLMNLGFMILCLYLLLVPLTIQRLDDYALCGQVFVCVFLCGSLCYVYSVNLWEIS